MKKIIMAAAIVCAAVCAQASAVAWGINSGSLDTGVFAEGTAYLVCVADLAKPSLADEAAAQAWYTANGANLSETAFRTAAVVDGGFYETEDIAQAIGRKNYYVVVVNKDASAMAITTTTKALNITTGALATTAAWTGTQFNNYALVPEPTSGLLMLVGLAGLALRRRRA